MIESYGHPYNLTKPIVGRLSLYDDPALERFPLFTHLEKELNLEDAGKCSAFITNKSRKDCELNAKIIRKPGLFSVDMQQFRHGDGIALLPQGKALLVYRPTSNSNALFVTSRCNSNCIMCPQPPQEEDCDQDLAFDILNVIDPEVEMIGITGGEPTLLGEKLSFLIEMAKKKFPLAALHILTNGRYFSNPENAHKLSLIGHPNMLFGVPLFSDNAYDHENITRTHGSFIQTIKGIVNLARFQVPIEIRIVMIKQVVSRLDRLVEFIYRNFPFVSQVCFMGLEPIGFARQNFAQIWEDPIEYQQILKKAVYFLTLRGIDVNIYNEQLCILDHDLRKFHRKSISDWKNVFHDKCSGCILMEKCGGFFSSSTDNYYSRGIQKVSDAK